MTKSKLVKINQKIADKVVSGYTKIEDAFVKKYLMHDGETIKEAKERLKKEQKNNKKD